MIPNSVRTFNNNLRQVGFTQSDFSHSRGWIKQIFVDRANRCTITMAHNTDGDEVSVTANVAETKVVLLGYRSDLREFFGAVVREVQKRSSV